MGKGKMQFRILGFMGLLFCISGCYNQNFCEYPNLKKQVSTELQFLFTNEERVELEQLESDEGVRTFVENLWHRLDPDTMVEGNELREIYETRLAYVKEHYPFNCGWGFSPRARVYLIWGPPDFVDEVPWSNDLYSAGQDIVSLEVWAYNAPADFELQTERLQTIFPNMQKFVFGDLNGLGIYELLFSTSKYENNDPYIMLKGE